MKTTNVFGISTRVRPDSYIDRNNLDIVIKRLLQHDTHIALKGASKCGKSWLRQQSIVNDNTVQCRLGKTVQDIYVEALANLGIVLEIEKSSSTKISGNLEATGEAGLKILTKVAGTFGIELEHTGEKTTRNLKCDLTNLKFITELIKESNTRLVVEDFHYLSIDERRKFSFDLKTLWDLECYVIIVGVWTQTNLLTFLNPDLSGRIEEVVINWSNEDLLNVINKGSQALKITISESIKRHLLEDSVNNVGILQRLLLDLVESQAGIMETCALPTLIENVTLYHNATKNYANQLDGIYQEFAKIVSAGIRKRKDSTGIYAYTMKAIVESSDQKLLDGLSRDEIFQITHSLQERIQTGNLKTILGKVEELQVDDAQRGLVVGYDQSTDSVYIVDHQLLFYRRHHTMNWPWEELAEESTKGDVAEEQLTLYGD